MAKPAHQEARDSLVLQVPALEPVEAETQFLTRLALETDPSDVHADLGKGVTGFVVVDCRPAEDYAKGHVPGALNLPYKSITVETAKGLEKEMIYVPYDSGLYDNAATKTALRLSALGLRVKEMSGGLAGWQHEGYPVAVGSAPGKLAVKPPLQRL